jgi:uncharacterized protein YggE
VTPIRDWEKDHYVDKGIRAAMTLEVTTSEISRMGEAMVEASKVGIQNVGSMTTYLSLEKSQAEYLKCLDVASQDARKKADQLAKKLNFSIGNVISVIESPAPKLPPMPIYERSMSMKSKSMMDTTTVEPGTQNFSTSIQVTYSIK